MRAPAPVFTPTWRRVSPATPLADPPAKPAKALSRVSRVPEVAVWRVNESDPGTVPVHPSDPAEPSSTVDPITELEGANVLPFRPTRPAGEPYRLGDHHYMADAVRGGEPCPTCRSTDWRLTPTGHWLCGSSLHYWQPARPEAGGDR